MLLAEEMTIIILVNQYFQPGQMAQILQNHFFKIKNSRRTPWVCVKMLVGNRIVLQQSRLIPQQSPFLCAPYKILAPTHSTAPSVNTPATTPDIIPATPCSFARQANKPTRLTDATLSAMPAAPSYSNAFNFNVAK